MGSVGNGYYLLQLHTSKPPTRFGDETVFVLKMYKENKNKKGLETTRSSASSLVKYLAWEFNVRRSRRTAAYS